MSHYTSYRRNLLWTSALAGALLCGGTAFAQESTPPAAAVDPSVSEDGDIIVDGIRESLRNSIRVKRDANAVVDVISAEGIGKFPDRNVAESLSHIPGVSIDRRFGEGEKVAIHGTDPALNRMLLDGHAVASADWGGNDNDPSSRTFNYSLLAPELVDRLEVYKSPEPRIEEGSIGGTVIVRTRRPLDLPANSLFASAGYAYNDRSEKGSLRGSGLYSWRNDAGTFGILGAVTYDKQQLVRSGIEFFGFENAGSRFLTTNAAGQRVLRNPNAVITGGTAADLDNATSPFGINYAYFQQQRERKSYTVTAQVKPTDNFTLTANGLRIDGQYNNYNQAMYVIPGAWSGDVLQSATITDGVVTSASFGAASATSPGSAQLDKGVRRTKLRTDNINLVGDWEVPGGGTMTFAGGWSEAIGGKDPEYLFDLRTDLPYSYSFTPTSANVDFVGDIGNPANVRNSNGIGPQTDDQGQPIIVNGTQLVAARAGGIDVSRTTDRDVYAGFDAVAPVAFGLFTELLLGARYTDHENRVDGAGTNNYSRVAYRGSQLGVPTSTVPEGIFDGTGGTGNATGFVALSEQAVIDILANSINIDLGRKPNASYSVTEKTLAAYVQLNFEQNALRGNVGGRFVNTENESFYALTQNNNPVPVQQAVKSDYMKFLPSVNVAYEFGPRFLLRGSIAKVIARPRYQELAGSFSQNDITNDAGGGNPNLKPYQSVNYELSAEFYPRPGALLSLELFRRDIKDYIYTARQEGVILYNQLEQRFEAYGVNRPFNGGNAQVNGVLVAAQGEIWNGFGLQANYSYADSTTDEGLNLPYLSKHTVNVIPYFEKGPFQARVSYNYRSSYFRAIGRLNSLDSTDAYSQLDASAAIKLTDAITVSVNAQNLLDETYLQYSGTRDQPNAFYKNGRTLAAAVSFKM